jgi:hypothetical protein
VDVNEALALVQALSPEERASLQSEIALSPALSLWSPLPGPQTLAYTSPADELFFGGSAGGGKSSFIVGMALTRHRRTLIIRRESTQLRGIIDDIAKALHTRDGLNVQAGQWRIPADRALFPDQLIEFGGVPNPGDEERHQGIAHDLLAFDEATQLNEYVINYLTTWNRTTAPGQRCRILLTSNPPTPSTAYSSRGQATGGGAWIIRRYAPWLDPQYRDPHRLGPAKPGELRWFVTLNGVEQEWPDPLPFIHHDSKSRRDETILPRSRTFIPALASQNPYTGEAYIATLQKLPEPLRSALLYGDFSVSLTDQPLQLFPSDWVREATKRHTQGPQPGYPQYPPADPDQPLTAIGADIARGGADTTVLILRYGQWFAPPILLTKTETADGPAAAGVITKYRRDQCPIVVDANGVGASVYDHLRANNPEDSALKAHVGSEASSARDRSMRYGFVNRRSEVYWKLREALDPGSPYQLSIPNDEELVQELLSLTWEEQSGKIKVMTKKDHIRVLGRSPDKSDALTLAWSVRDDADPTTQQHLTARQERLAEAEASRKDPQLRSKMAQYTSSLHGRRARWGDARLPYPTRY